MRKHPQSEVRKKINLVKKIVQHHFGSLPKKIEFKPAGFTNFVFEVKCRQGNFIVRIAAIASRFKDFQKEQWAVDKVKKLGVPVAEILEVGNEIVDLPYMLQKKIDGKEATNHPDRLRILFELGHYAQLIHTIHTTNYGNSFDWSKNRLSKNKTWKEYLLEEFNIHQRIEILKENEMLTKTQVKKISSLATKMEKWKEGPVLNHGDLRLKNVIIDNNGKLLALIDWEHCCSNMAPYWDLSIALHDLSVDAKEEFLKGYGIDPSSFNDIAPYLKVFNILNYSDIISRKAKRRDKKGLDFYRLRLQGSLDLFSI
jgi:aminoglycoside phosphotransferase (APT) family kinase protein